MNKLRIKYSYVKIYPFGSNILNRREIFVMKNDNTYEDIYKARVVAQGHNEKAKQNIVDESSSVKQI